MTDFSRFVATLAEIARQPGGREKLEKVIADLEPALAAFQAGDLERGRAILADLQAEARRKNGSGPGN